MSLFSFHIPLYAFSRLKRELAYLYAKSYWIEPQPYESRKKGVRVSGSESSLVVDLSSLVKIVNISMQYKCIDWVCT